MSKHFTIGTRGSLLAVTQCSLIQELLEQKSGNKFSLETIQTQGDQITDKALWQLEGKDFFTKELDAALLQDKVDLVVHSYKDLGSERPEGIELGAVTQRQFANDILLMKKETIKNLGALDKIVIGTSSPRRIINIECSLLPYLPGVHANTKIECQVLRGNVNTRIQKLKDGGYHGIVLALAGLERLASHPDSEATLKNLLNDLDFLILPQREFPSSASQGALAIEYHSNAPEAKSIERALATVHHDTTASEVRRERKAFKAYGGGCHLAVGIFVKKVKDHYVHIEKGQVDNKLIEKIFIEDQDLSELKGKTSFLVLGEQDQLTVQKSIISSVPNDTNLFVTSKYCFHVLNKNQQNHLWAAGTRTAKALTAAGFWVNGVCDFAGHDELVELKNSNAVKMICGKNWKVLSHSESDSPVGEVIGCYEREYSGDAHNDIFKADILFWGSFECYTQYIEKYPELDDKIHTCGLGKTYESFLQAKKIVVPIIDMKAFKSLTKVIS